MLSFLFTPEKSVYFLLFFYRIYQLNHQKSQGILWGKNPGQEHFNARTAESGQSQPYRKVADRWKRAEGMVVEMEANYMASFIDKAIGYTDTKNREVSWKLENRNVIEVQTSPELCIGWSVDPTISAEVFRNEEEAVNEAAITLLPDELQAFMEALIQHRLLLPTNFSQNLTRVHGKIHLQLTTREPFDVFVERLSDALHAGCKNKR